VIPRTIRASIASHGGEGASRDVTTSAIQRLGTEIVAAYTRQPQTDEELAGLDLATRALVAEEPWCLPPAWRTTRLSTK
jgi:hypothetical protein